MAARVAASGCSSGCKWLRAQVAASGCALEWLLVLEWLPVAACVGCLWLRVGLAASGFALEWLPVSALTFSGIRAAVAIMLAWVRHRTKDNVEHLVILNTQFPAKQKSKLEGNFQERLVRSESLMTIGRTLTAMDCGVQAVTLAPARGSGDVLWDRTRLT